MNPEKNISRRTFVAGTSAVVLGTMLTNPISAIAELLVPGKPLRIAMVGTGHRGTGMWGRDAVKTYGKSIEFVGLCDINPGRLEFAKTHMNVSCPVFTDFDEMLKKTNPEAVIVTTVDATHNYFIVKALAAGINVITEKPLTTDEIKLKEILDAERKYGKKIIVTFNYRYSPHRSKIKELLSQGRIGRVTSVDFHWYLDVYHGADYFRRWHRLREKGGTLLVHKATHHFDLLNWWIDSDPLLVNAYGELEFYGKNNSFRSTTCRGCAFKDKCKFFFDVTKDARLMALYVENEKYDGYVRDGCVWKEDINIYDKMAVQIKYKNNVQVSYSLTTYSPYEGYRIAFNGTEGRIEAWIHERQPWTMEKYDEIQITDNFGKMEFVHVSEEGGGHGGGDDRLKDEIFLNQQNNDPLHRAAGIRDGALSVLIGIAARKSIESGKPISIADLTDLTLNSQKQY
ncbi:MAG: Gfo/Idh/MocA family oxidoreductase [Bacteroidota bacterium]|nr:Gfo/Idh/MocA family oxidoreductase [Bacteroidota bacterium]